MKPDFISASSAGCCGTRASRFRIDADKPVLPPDSLAMIDDFCDALWLEDGLAKNSLDAYRRDMRLFAIWLHAERAKNLLAAQAERFDRLLCGAPRRHQGHLGQPAAGGVEAVLSTGAAAE